MMASSAGAKSRFSNSEASAPISSSLNYEQALGNALMHSHALKLGDDSSRLRSVADLETSDC
ncbi:hypothetical protein [Candidatus Poriferisodalis sp.]|uniref:hypothetical protein n=1 Tax=Candidatus Poriferisodalis sp. TaxID=3101277 RepID=UPI003B01B23F